jgi:hypothetical protein
VSWARYIPQLFSLRLPSAEVIFELLQKAGAKVLIYDAACEADLKGSPVPLLFAQDAKEMGEVDQKWMIISRICLRLLVAKMRLSYYTPVGRHLECRNLFHGRIRG